MGNQKKKPEPEGTPLTDAVVLTSKKAVWEVNRLAAMTGDDPNRVLVKAICLYRDVKLKEAQGYLPAMVKDGKATFITGI
jgi:hypothetical protein